MMFGSIKHSSPLKSKKVDWSGMENPESDRCHTAGEKRRNEQSPCHRIQNNDDVIVLIVDFHLFLVSKQHLNVTGQCPTHLKTGESSGEQKKLYVESCMWSCIRCDC